MSTACRVYHQKKKCYCNVIILSFSLFISLHLVSSFLFLQLYYSIWGTAVSQLPPGVRQQYALCMADHLQPRESNQSGFQRPQHGETVWLPLDQGWWKGSTKWNLLSSVTSITSFNFLYWLVLQSLCISVRGAVCSDESDLKILSSGPVWLF